MNKSEIAEKAVREIQSSCLGVDDEMGIVIFEAEKAKAIVERAIEESRAPQPEIVHCLKQTARIDQWSLIEMATESHLHGLVSMHPRQHEFSGMVYTSPIVKLDEAAGVCETNNTIYTLGTKR